MDTQQKGCRWPCLNNNQLKIIAMVAMLIDHIGAILLPSYELLRIIGRISFPIFAYMIAEGCRYTKNRRKYLFTLSLLALVFQAVYSTVSLSLHLNIFVTLSMSVAAIFVTDAFLKKKSKASFACMLAIFTGIALVCFLLPSLLDSCDFHVEYGFFGTMLPVFVYFSPSKVWKIVSATITLIIMSLLSEVIHQWFALFAIPLLLLYNGERGKLRLKYMFYIFYPTHLVVLYLIAMLL